MRDQDYPEIYYTTIKGVHLRYCQSIGELKYCELYKAGNLEHEEIDVRIRHKDALRLGLRFIDNIHAVTNMTFIDQLLSNRPKFHPATN